jgi:hypothetical protein
MVEQLTRTEFCTIEGPVEAVTGKYGPQYQFKAAAPWSIYAPMFWVEQKLMPRAATAEQREALKGTGHWATFRRGPLQKDQEGNPKDSELDYSYRWDIIAWDVDAPTGGSTGGGTGGGTGRTGGTNRSIERQVAFKGVIELVLAQLIEIADIPDFTDRFAGIIAGDGMDEPSNDEVAPPVDNSEGHMVRDAESLGAVIIEETLNEAPAPAPCATHGGAVFEYKQGVSGVSRWTHLKADGGWCIFDGELPGMPPTPVPNF